MAFPTSSSAGIFSERWSTILRTTENMRSLAQRLKDQLDNVAMTVYAHKVGQFSTTLQSEKGTLDGLVSGANTGTPSFASYAQGQVSDSGINIVAEYTSLDTAHAALISFLDTNLPNIGIYNFSGGVLVPIELNAVQKAALSTELGTYLAEFLS